MTKNWIAYFFFFALALAASGVRAQEVPLTQEEALAQAILDMTTTERRHLSWRPCGEHFRGHAPEAHTYALEISRALLVAAGEDLDPWWMAAQLMQESGFNPCAFSSREFAVYRRSLGHRPTQRDILLLLNSSRRRQEHGIRGMDGGLAQFRWPGTVARRVGIEAPRELLDVGTSLQAFAQALRLYRTRCEEVPVFRGTETRTRRGRVHVVRYAHSCSEYFWVIHNTGSAIRINPRYIRNVTRRYHRGPERWRARYEQEHPGA